MYVLVRSVDSPTDIRRRNHLVRMECNRTRTDWHDIPYPSRRRPHRLHHHTVKKQKKMKFIVLKCLYPLACCAVHNKVDYVSAIGNVCGITGNVKLTILYLWMYENVWETIRHHVVWHFNLMCVKRETECNQVTVFYNQVV